MPISSSYNAVKILIAVFRTLYPSSILYRSREDQLNRYGYAAFSLTMVPYAIMSVVSLIGALVTPSYPNLYLVRSKAYWEIGNRHPGNFDGTIGEIKNETPYESPTLNPTEGENRN